MNDIKFYDFDFNLLRVLPQYATNLTCGYISANAQIDYNDLGSFELDFIDEDTKEIVIAHPEGLLVEFSHFQGIITGYLFNTQYKLLGLSLNAILHRIVVPETATTLSGNVETLARSAISSHASWITLGAVAGCSNRIEYSTDTYQTADEYIKNLLDLDNAGYKVTADFENKQFVFEVIKSEEKDLILSSNLQNAYDFAENFDNKNRAIGGWYQRQSDDGSIWTYITTDNTATGINKIDTVLSATTASEAMQELNKLKTEHNVEFKTKGVGFKSDYNLGDIVRVQNNDTATRKRVIGVIISQETGYFETPVLTEL